MMATFAFAWQIYFDFSGYTDMARGVARAMGFQLVLNFNHPYLSTGLGEFWTRWHISLSNLVSAITSTFRWAAIDVERLPRIWQPAAVVFVVSGIWHGAAWTFAIWGALHAAGIMLTPPNWSGRSFIASEFPPPSNRRGCLSLSASAWIFPGARVAAGCVADQSVTRIFHADAAKILQTPAADAAADRALVWLYQAMCHSRHGEESSSIMSFASAWRAHDPVP